LRIAQLEAEIKEYDDIGGLPDDEQMEFNQLNRDIRAAQ
jgi:hypothetical protein